MPPQITYSFCVSNYLFFLMLPLSWLASCAATSHWLFPGSQACFFYFFIRWRSVSDRAAGFVVGAVFVAFVCAHARGQATFITGTDDNLCSYSQLLHFLVWFRAGFFLSHLVQLLLGDAGWILNNVAVGLLLCFHLLHTHTHIVGTYKVQFTFMKDSLSLHVS